MLSDGTYVVNAGGIYRIRTSNGFGISVPGYEEVRDSEPSWTDIASYVERHADALAGPGRYLGIWRDSGSVYMDVTELHRVPVDCAAIIGAERGQVAIWDFKNRCAIYL